MEISPSQNFSQSRPFDLLLPSLGLPKKQNLKSVLFERNLIWAEQRKLLVERGCLVSQKYGSPNFINKVTYQRRETYGSVIHMTPDEYLDLFFASELEHEFDLIDQLTKLPVKVCENVPINLRLLHVPPEWLTKYNNPWSHLPSIHSDASFLHGSAGIGLHLVFPDDPVFGKMQYSNFRYHKVPSIECAESTGIFRSLDLAIDNKIGELVIFNDNKNVNDGFLKCGNLFDEFGNLKSGHLHLENFYSNFEKRRKEYFDKVHVAWIERQFNTVANRIAYASRFNMKKLFSDSDVLNEYAISEMKDRDKPKLRMETNRTVLLKCFQW